MLKKFVFCLLILLASAANGQINPVTQIRWPQITGAGAPSSLSISCTPLNYGQPYQNTAVTPNIFYTCGTDGWQTRGAVTGTAPVVATPSGSTVNISCPNCAENVVSRIGLPSTLENNNNFPAWPGLTTLADGNPMAMWVDATTATGSTFTDVSFTSGSTWSPPVVWTPPTGYTPVYTSLTTLQNGTIFASVPLSNNAYPSFEKVTPAYSIGTNSNPVHTYNVGSTISGMAVDASGGTYNGDVWAAAPGINSVLAITPSGTIAKTCSGINNISYGQIAVDQSTENIWVAIFGTNQVVEMSPNCTVLHTVTVGVNPYYIAIDSSHNAWVTNYGAGGQGATVTGITISGGAVTAATISGGTGYPNSNTVIFTSSNGAGFGGTCTATATAGTFGAGVSCASFTGASGLTANPTGLVQNIGTVSEVSAAGSVLGTISLVGTDSSVGSYPAGIVIDSSNHIWVANIGAGNGNINDGVMEIVSGVVQPSLFVQYSPQALAIDSGGNIWSITGTGWTTEISSTGTVEFAFQSGGDGQAISIYGGNIFTADAVGNRISEWTSAGGLVGEFSSVSQPFSLAITSTGNALVGSFNSTSANSVSVASPIDTFTWVTSTITMPVGLTVCPDTSPVVQLSSTKLILPIYCASPTAIYPNQYPNSAGYVVSNDGGSTWSAFTVIASAANDPVQPSNGYDESAMMNFPNGDVVDILRHNQYPTGDPYGTYARSVSHDGGTTWSSPVDVVNLGDVVGRPSLLLLADGRLLLCGRGNVPQSYDPATRNSEHICQFSSDEGMTWNTGSDVSISGSDEGYEALTTISTGQIGEVQSSLFGDGLQFTLLSPFGVVQPKDVNINQASYNQTLTNPTEVNGQDYWNAGTSPVHTFYNSTPFATQSTIAFGFYGLNSQYTNFGAYNVVPTKTTGYVWNCGASATTSLLGCLRLAPDGDLTPHGDYYSYAGNIVIPHTASAYFGSSTGSPLLCSGTPTAGKYCDGATGAWTVLPTPVSSCTWTPVAHSFTQAGGNATLAATCTIVGGVTYFNMVITPVTSTTSVLGTTYFTLPSSMSASHVSCSASDGFSTAIGGGCYMYSNILLTPAWTADTNPVTVSGWYY